MFTLISVYVPSKAGQHAQISVSVVKGEQETGWVSSRTNMASPPAQLLFGSRHETTFRSSLQSKHFQPSSEKATRGELRKTSAGGSAAGSGAGSRATGPVSTAGTSGCFRFWTLQPPYFSFYPKIKSINFYLLVFCVVLHSKGIWAVWILPAGPVAP